MASEKDPGGLIRRIAQKEREIEAELVRARSEAEFIEERARKEAFEILARAEAERRKLGEEIAGKRALGARMRSDDRIREIHGLEMRVLNLSGEVIDGFALEALRDIFPGEDFKSK